MTSAAGTKVGIIMANPEDGAYVFLVDLPRSGGPRRSAGVAELVGYPARVQVNVLLARIEKEGE